MARIKRLSDSTTLVATRVPSMVDDPQSNRYLSTSEAAKLIGLSEIRVRQFCQSGRLGEKICGRYAISYKELQAFQAQERVNGRPSEKK